MEGEAGFKRVTLFPDGDSRRAKAGEVRNRLYSVLREHNPQAVAVPGWSDTGALLALTWCLESRKPCILMSDSSAVGRSRSRWKELPKRQLVALFSSALVAGKPHTSYLAGLGMPRERAFFGYDAVDNRYFTDKAAEVRGHRSEVRRKYGLPERYFLASARFITEKNLPRLIQAYARYRELALKAESGKRKPEIWSLVLLGDGPLKADLCRLISDLSLQHCVVLPGFKQYDELPVYYGLASAFILPSVSETWGLVVNEAMASSLPVLVSNRCGCAADLVQEGRNGFTFDPYNVEHLAALMLKMSAVSFPLSALGAESQRIIANWGPDRFAQGLKAAVDKALEVGPIKPTLTQKLILKALLLR